MPKTELLKKSFSYNGAKIWNSFPNEIDNYETFATFDELISTQRPNVIIIYFLWVIFNALIVYWVKDISENIYILDTFEIL